jgi:hypothetical protein
MVPPLHTLAGEDANGRVHRSFTQTRPGNSISVVMVGTVGGASDIQLLVAPPQ